LHLGIDGIRALLRVGFFKIRRARPCCGRQSAPGQRLSCAQLRGYSSIGDLTVTVQEQPGFLREKFSGKFWHRQVVQHLARFYPRDGWKNFFKTRISLFEPSSAQTKRSGVLCLTDRSCYARLKSESAADGTGRTSQPNS